MKILFTLAAFICAQQLFAQKNIADARNLLNQEITVSGIVTNGDELGSIRYFQDETAGIAAYGNKISGINRGDSVTITGTLKDYRNLLEIDPVASVTVHSLNHQLPAPKIITVDEIGEKYEGQLVQIKNVEITNSIGTFSGNQNYSFTANGRQGELRINANSPIVGTVIPSEKFNLTGICSQFSYYNNDISSGYQILPRDVNDFDSVDPVNFTSVVNITGITKSGFDLNWKTDADASTEVRFGTTMDKSQWQYKSSEFTNSSEDGFLHEINISGLQPAAIVYAEAFSVLGTDTAFSGVGVYGTQSNSTGKINVYFNTPVDHSVATNVLAQNIGNAVEDTLIAYIDRAGESIDFCIYNINNRGISNVSEALNRAKNRGVKIRFITCGSTAHFGVENLDNEIPVLERPNENEGGIMHNKFAVFDANSTNPALPWVWTGSVNMTEDQINLDANNCVFIQDQTLAKAYRIEFEEMWGSNGIQPNPTNAKFGENKKDNTPHQFVIGETPVESYFSPSDNTNQKIADAINSADKALDIETMLITRSDLAQAIGDANRRGAEVFVLTNDAADNTETVNNILNNNLPTQNILFDNAVNGLLHNKLAIIDNGFPGSDPQVITGSHNWSNSANDKNDENTLIIHSSEIANIYFQQFAYRIAENGGNIYVSAVKTEMQEIKIFPNPASERITVSSSKPIAAVELFSSSGIKTGEYISGNPTRIKVKLNNLPSGIYLLKVRLNDGHFNTYKIVKE